MNRRVNRERRDGAWNNRGTERSPRTARGEDRTPILGGHDDVETGNLLDEPSWSMGRLDSQRSPFHEHPSPSNIFDDM